DSFGRVWWEQTQMPDSNPSRYTLYNAMGWKTHQSEYSVDQPKYTLYLNHDPFGRPRTVRPPDGTQHDVTYQYAGDRKVVRTTATGVYYSGGQVVEAPRSKTEFFDRQRRLWKEITRANNYGPDIVKVNSYDAARRLTQSADGNGKLIEGRYYDGRGF